MLATFVIGLREGLEAALIVAIIAGFLRQRGRNDAVRMVGLGVAIAIALCLAGAIALNILASELPQAQQEALEAIVALVAVVTVTGMLVWMRHHARGMKGELEASTERALATGTASALVVAAFLAVLREGFETSAFLLAAFNASTDPVATGVGALAGVLTASILGYAMYIGAIRINVGRLFRATAIVLVLIAGGLVASALHSATGAGWITFGQATAIDLAWLIRPGSLQGALATGVLGLQPRPTILEAAGWLAYVLIVGTYVLRPGFGASIRARLHRASDATAASR